MTFADYRDRAATLAADLVNTVGSITKTDYMSGLAELRRFLDDHGVSHGTLTNADLEDVHEVRAKLGDVFLARSDEATARALNAVLEWAGARPWVATRAGEWDMHYVADDAPVAQRLAITSALGLFTLISDLGRNRLGMCNADDCNDVFVDTSRNRSRRYCTDTCSTRMNVAAYRARRAGAG